jgi:hypothetical protein
MTDQPKISSTSPNKFRRVGRRGFRWDLPRSFPGYFADTKVGVLGAAPKYILRRERASDPQYIVKYAQKHGKVETLTEFFINRLGTALGLNIAHSGLLLSDGILTFATRIFLEEYDRLWHGSLIIEDCFKREAALDSKELEKIHPRTEQEFYSVDFVVSVLRAFCGKDFDAIFPPFIEMLVFDALVGSMDRHSQNWGVIAKSSGPVTYRFSPIFDTARALLWSLDEEQIERMSGEGEDDPEKRLVYESKLQTYIKHAQPCMGPERNHPKVNKCNHFDFVQNLLKLYPEPTMAALRKMTDRVEARSSRLMRQFPFRQWFTRRRKRLILKILSIRADGLRGIRAKGGT